MQFYGLIRFTIKYHKMIEFKPFWGSFELMDYLKHWVGEISHG
jgi:hypothetical protein